MLHLREEEETRKRASRAHSLYLGVDIGTKNLGLIVLTSARELLLTRTITSGSDGTDALRLSELRGQFKALLFSLFGIGFAKRGSIACIEAPSPFSPISFRLGRAYESALSVLDDLGIAGFSVSPSFLKKYALNAGKAKKPEIISAANALFPGEDFDEHRADAVWLACIAGHYAMGAAWPDADDLRFAMITSLPDTVEIGYG